MHDPVSCYIWETSDWADKSHRSRCPMSAGMARSSNENSSDMTLRVRSDRQCVTGLPLGVTLGTS